MFRIIRENYGQKYNKMKFYLPFLRGTGEWVESADAKHGGVGLVDAIICDKQKCD